MKAPDIEDIELRLLLEGIFQVYGCDFREYAEAHCLSLALRFLRLLL